MPDRQQVFYLAEAAITAGQTLPEIAAYGTGAAGAYVISKSAGIGHLKGAITGTTAPAAGFPRIRFWNAPGDSTALTAILTYSLTVDPLNAFSFLIDTPLWTPFFTVEWTQGVAIGTISGAAWVYPYIQGGSGSSSSGSPIFVKDAPLTDLGYFQGSVDGTTAKSLATLTGSAIPAGALYAQIQVDQAGTNVFCRWRADGTAPTATVGNPTLIPGSMIFYEGPLSTLSIIGSSAGPSVVNIQYYR